MSESRPKRKAAAVLSFTHINANNGSSESEGEAMKEEGSDQDGIASSSSTQQPKGRPGRKRINVVDPANKRLSQNRQAQRNYRERQLNHTKELEAKVSELTAILAAKEDGGEGTGKWFQELLDLRSETDSLRKLDADLTRQLLQLKESKIGIQYLQQECQNCLLERQKSVNLESRVSLLQAELEFLRNNRALNGTNDPNESRLHIHHLIDSPVVGLTPHTPLTTSYIPVPSVSINPITTGSSPNISIAASGISGSQTSRGNSESALTTPVISSSELFGPPIMDTLISQLRKLKSLADSPVVDEYAAVFVAQTKCADTKSIKLNIMKLIGVRRKLLDTCHAILDRRTAIEIFESFKEVNKKHLDYMYQQFQLLRDGESRGSPHSQTSSSPHISSDIHSQRSDRIVKTVTDQLTNIAALREAPDLIHECADILAVCVILSFTLLALLFKTRHPKSQTVGQDIEKFIRLVEVQAKLQALCKSEEDRTNLMLAIEIGRESNRKQITEAVGLAQTLES
ncbi:UNVERIFIED_CONTAM: hypothetical protein HDU68_011067 [Siphonaria sp. JEL0065]|nr:hypothetical protein HDU68_011067 [Siphonaria sp. JEL0065]